MSFVAIPAADFAARFTAAGFTAKTVNNEVVYERPHNKQPKLKIVVYSSMAVGQDACRDAGSDAIRVCLVWEGKTKKAGIWKAKRVNRTGTPAEVIERTIERAREAYSQANEELKNTCKGCGAPVWADSGRCVVRCA